MLMWFGDLSDFFVLDLCGCAEANFNILFQKEAGIPKKNIKVEDIPGLSEYFCVGYSILILPIIQTSTSLGESALTMSLV